MLTVNDDGYKIYAQFSCIRQFSVRFFFFFFFCSVVSVNDLAFVSHNKNQLFLFMFKFTMFRLETDPKRSLRFDCQHPMIFFLFCSQFFFYELHSAKKDSPRMNVDVAGAKCVELNITLYLLHLYTYRVCVSKSGRRAGERKKNRKKKFINHIVNKIYLPRTKTAGPKALTEKWKRVYIGCEHIAAKLDLLLLFINTG